MLLAGSSAAQVSRFAGFPAGKGSREREWNFAGDWVPSMLDSGCVVAGVEGHNLSQRGLATHTQGPRCGPCSNGRRKRATKGNTTPPAHPHLWSGSLRGEERLVVCV